MPAVHLSPLRHLTISPHFTRLLFFSQDGIACVLCAGLSVCVCLCVCVCSQIVNNLDPTPLIQNVVGFPTAAKCVGPEPSEQTNGTN